MRERVLGEKEPMANAEKGGKSHQQLHQREHKTQWD